MDYLVRRIAKTRYFRDKFIQAYAARYYPISSASRFKAMIDRARHRFYLALLDQI
ncbi:hypothetical protein I0600191H4_13640 [Collinsella sp. i06-0019-1H4]